MERESPDPVFYTTKTRNQRGASTREHAFGVLESRSFRNLLFKAQAVAEGIDRIHHFCPIRCDIQSGVVVLVVFGEKLGVKLLYALSSDQGCAPGRRIPMMLAQMQRQASARKLHVERGSFKDVALPVDRKAEEINIEFLRLDDIEHADYGDGGGKFYSIAGFRNLFGLGDLCCQDVPVVEPELLGDEFQALSYGEDDVPTFQIVAYGLRHCFCVVIIAH